MVHHVWLRVSDSGVWEGLIRDVMVFYKCHRCGSNLTLRKGFRPEDQDAKIVSAGLDCDLALVRNLTEE